MYKLIPVLILVLLLGGIFYVVNGYSLGLDFSSSSAAEKPAVEEIEGTNPELSLPGWMKRLGRYFFGNPGKGECRPDADAIMGGRIGIRCGL